MRRQRMSYDERETRRQARYYGTRCAQALEQFTFHQREANQWRAVDGLDSDLTTRWQLRADEHAKDAIEYATKAAHEARRLLVVHA